MKNQIIKTIFSGLIVCTMVFTMVGNVWADEVSPDPIICTSWTYSDWSACQPDGTQTRTVISSSPGGCIGSPVLEQSCTLSPACTDGYFCDTETSTDNEMVSGTLDFSLASADFSPSTILKGETTNRNIILTGDGSLEFKYDAGIMQTGGEALFCNALKLKVTEGSTTLYDDYLMSFSLPESTYPGSSEDLSFEITLPLDASDSLQGQICQFKLDFDAWQTDLSYGQGFNDEEELDNTIKSGYWNPPVVLNEFLPNPSGGCSSIGINGQWVEIYNKTLAPLDLSGWHVTTNSGQVIIQNSNTLSGSTTIGAKGSGSEWLVVFMNGCVMNDSGGDTITLTDANNIQVDSYTYTTPQYDVNHTPGSSNDIVMYLPLDGDANDQSGNSNNGTNNGATFATGKFNQGLSFDGVNDYVNCGTNGSLNILSEITIEAWINPDMVIKPSYHSSIVDRGNSYWFLILNTGKLAFLRFNQNDPQTGYGRFSIFSTDVTIPTGVWTHVVATYSVSGGNAVKLYINGLLSKAGSFTNGPIDSSNDTLTIGNRMSLHYFDGSIDEVKIYNRALNASEILGHYGQIPANKSYARIPDGSSNWVDPIPTPGAPNELEDSNVVEETINPFEIQLETIVLESAENSLTTEPVIEPVVEEIIEQLPTTDNSSTTTEEVVTPDEPVVITKDNTEVIEEQIESVDDTTTDNTENIIESANTPIVEEIVSVTEPINEIVPEI